MPIQDDNGNAPKQPKENSEKGNDENKEEERNNEEEENDAGEKILKEEAMRKRKRGFNVDENESEEEEANESDEDIKYKRQQKVHDPYTKSTNKQLNNQNMSRAKQNHKK